MIWIGLAMCIIGAIATLLLFHISQKLGWVNHQIASVIRHLERINGDKE